MVDKFTGLYILWLVELAWHCAILYATCKMWVPIPVITITVHTIAVCINVCNTLYTWPDVFYRAMGINLLKHYPENWWNVLGLHQWLDQGTLCTHSTHNIYKTTHKIAINISPICGWVPNHHCKFNIGGFKLWIRYGMSIINIMYMI